MSEKLEQNRDSGVDVEHAGEGCAVDCSRKGLSPECGTASSCGGGAKPQVGAWLALAVTLFVVAVWLLGNFGKPLLESMGRSEKTVAYLDMARQNVQTRDYAAAEKLYQQAIADAELQGGGDNLAYALAVYAEFLRKRKRVAEAVPLELRAKQIQGITGAQPAQP